MWSLLTRESSPEITASRISISWQRQRISCRARTNEFIAGGCNMAIRPMHGPSEMDGCTWHDHQNGCKRYACAWHNHMVAASSNTRSTCSKLISPYGRQQQGRRARVWKSAVLILHQFYSKRSISKVLFCRYYTTALCHCHLVVLLLQHTATFSPSLQPQNNQSMWALWLRFRDG